MRSSPTLHYLVLALVAALGSQNGRALAEKAHVRAHSSREAAGTRVRGRGRVVS